MAEHNSYPLSVASACCDAGTPEGLPQDRVDWDPTRIQSENMPIDLDGHARFSGSGIDMGAYEYQETSSAVLAH